MKQDSNPASLILITGGLQIPDRISEIPEEIKKVLSHKKNKFEYILSTGLGSSSSDRESIEFLQSLLLNQNQYSIKNLIDVKSEDSLSSDSKNQINSKKEIETIKIGDFIISIINGYQIVPWGDIDSLSSIQKQTGCDILVSGYTHKPSIFNYEGKYFINPGSMTGAYSPLCNDPNPSFIVFIVNGDCGVVYLYELNTSTKNFEVSKYEVNKIKNEQNVS